MFWTKKSRNVDRTTAILSVVAMLALLTAAGAMRWAWVLLDEQVELRKDFVELQNRQDQLEIQFDFWDKKVAEERKELKELRTSAPAR